MPSVRIPTVLRKHTDGQPKVAADGATVREVFTGIVAAHPGLEDQLFEGEQLRGFINVYVEDEDIRYIDGLDTKVQADDEIAIMPAVAGGAELPGGSEHARRLRVAGGAELPGGSEHARRLRVAGGAELPVGSEHARRQRAAGGAGRGRDAL